MSRPTALPDKPSELLRLAVKDVKACQRKRSNFEEVANVADKLGQHFRDRVGFVVSSVKSTNEKSP